MAEAESRNNVYETGYGKPPVQHQFKSGNPGRPKGSRNKLGEEFIKALYADFKENGEAAIQAVRKEKPDAYLKVIASLLPAQLNVNVNHELSDAELDDRIRQLASALGVEVGTPRIIDGEATERSH